MENGVDPRTEQQVRGYLSSRLDRIPVRSAPRFTPARVGWLSRLAAVPIMGALFLAAIAGGLAFGSWRDQLHETGQVAATPTPSASFAGFASPPFAPPSNCRFVTSTVDPTQAIWSFDCGAANADARGALRSSVIQQGWVSCGVQSGRDVYAKGRLTLFINNPGVPPGALPTLMVTSQSAANCVASAASPTPAPPTPSLGPGPTATITGRFGYGSDFIPPVTVYAISTTNPQIWYSVNFAGFGNPPRATLPPGMTEPGYSIAGIAPGTYWVVAYRNDGQLPDPGFYSRQPECFRARPSGPCPDINPAPVTVIAGQTATGIDVLTWGTQPQPSPSLPPRPTPR